jgi:hypothetical protein
MFNYLLMNSLESIVCKVTFVLNFYRSEGHLIKHSNIAHKKPLAMQAFKRYSYLPLSLSGSSAAMRFITIFPTRSSTSSAESPVGTSSV